MRRILRFEFHKLFRQRSFYICSLVTAVLLILGIPVFTKIAKMELSGWEYAAMVLSNSQYTMILGIFTSLFICDDFDQQVLKNIYSKGYSRRKVFVGKYISSLFAAGMMYLFDIIVAFIGGTVVWGVGEVGDSIRTLFLQGLVLIGYHAFFFALSMILGRTGPSIAIGIVATTMITLVLTILDVILKPKKFSFTDYWLDAFLNNAGDSDVKTKVLAVSLVGTFLFAAVFLAVGYAFNRKKQV
ncbi:MAG: ABC transporter permease [Ruminococcus sp.]|nr:ABC transporter permease [Ruminococcus sp.]